SRAIEDKIGRDVDDPRIDLTGNLREMLDTGHIRPPGDLALHLRVIYLNKPSAIDNGIRLCGVDNIADLRALRNVKSVIGEDARLFVGFGEEGLLLARCEDQVALRLFDK